MAVTSPKSTKAGRPRRRSAARVRPVDWTNPVAKPIVHLVHRRWWPGRIGAAEWAIRLGLRWHSSNATDWAAIPSIRHRPPPSRSSDGGCPCDHPRAEDLAPRHRLTCRWTFRRSWRACGVSARGSPNITPPIAACPGRGCLFRGAHFSASDALRSRYPAALKKALIATGSRPQRPTIPGLEEAGYLTSETIFDLAALPKRPGPHRRRPLGCEAAQTFSRLGTHVTSCGRTEISAHEKETLRSFWSFFVGPRWAWTRGQHPASSMGVRVEKRRQDTGYGQ